MADYGASDTSTTTLGANQFPISEVYTPNTGLRALEGGPSSTDGSSKTSAPVSIYAKAGTLVDGSDATQGTTTQTKATDGSATSWSVVQLLKGIFDKLLNTLAVTQSGTWTVQPGNTANTTAWKVDGSAVTQPVSNASLPLPTGASTSAKQPALGTAGTASADVLSIQGVASMTPVKVDGSGVTQPVSGTVTANAGTNMSTAALALESGGNLATLAGIVSSAKAAVKAASGDFADGSQVAIGTTTQAKATDATTTSWSVVQLLKGIFNSLLGTLTVQTVVGTTGGSTPFHLLSAASNNATSLKASAGLMYGYSISNTTASVRWVKFYNKASAPAPATDTVVWAEEIPANGVVLGAFPEGMGFATGIAFAAVVNASDTDNTSIGAGDLSIDIRYK